MACDVCRIGSIGCQRRIGRLGHLTIDLPADGVEECLRRRAGLDEEPGERRDRIAPGLLGPFIRRLVEPLVVRK